MSCFWRRGCQELKWLLSGIDLIGSEAVRARRFPVVLCEAFVEGGTFALTRDGAGQRVGEAAAGEPARVFRTRGSSGSVGPRSR